MTLEDGIFRFDFAAEFLRISRNTCHFGQFMVYFVYPNVRGVYSMSDYMPDQCLTVVKAAERLGVSDKTVRRWIKSGKIEGFIEKGKYLIPRAEVDKQSAQRGTQSDLVSPQAAEEISMLRKRIRELEEDRALLHNQIATFNETIEQLRTIIDDLTPKALPKPQLSIGKRFLRLFRRTET